ncbi:unnamed protein product, partial [Cylicostephanus goldi]
SLHSSGICPVHPEWKGPSGSASVVVSTSAGVVYLGGLIVPVVLGANVQVYLGGLTVANVRGPDGAAVDSIQSQLWGGLTVAGGFVDTIQSQLWGGLRVPEGFVCGWYAVVLRVVHNSHGSGSLEASNEPPMNKLRI